MATASWEHQNEAREALRFIVSEPGYGAAALSNPQTMASLLKDLLPDAPREKSVLIAASEAGLPGQLASHVSQGMDLATASALTAASFSEHTGYPEDVGGWVVGELAQALGLSSAAPGGAQPGGAQRGGPSAQSPPGFTAPGAGQGNNPAPGPATADTYVAGATVPPAGQPPASGQAGTAWGGQPPGAAPTMVPGAFPAGGQQPGYPYGGPAPGPPSGKRPRNRTGLIIAAAIAAAVVVIVVVVFLVTSGPSPAPTEALSKIIAPMIRNSEITGCVHTTPISGLTNVTVAKRCTANSGAIRVYLDQFGSASAYQAGVGRQRAFLGFSGGTQPFCGPSQNSSCSSLWFSKINKKYTKRPGQVLQERYVNASGGNVATFMWTLPTQQVIIVAQSNTSTLPDVYSWWVDLNYG
jgi:hypothetical protein